MEYDSEAGDPEAANPKVGNVVPRIDPGTPFLSGSQGPVPTKRSRFRRAAQVGVALGLASGVGVGAAALASAATSSTSPSGSGTPKASAPPAFGHHFGSGHGFAGRGFAGAGFGGFGPVLHGEATVKGPNGYETIEVQSGTVTSLKDVSGSTWSLVVTSADKTALTYTVDSGTSVNGGETGISAVKAGDTVNIVAVMSKGTATAKALSDTTRMQANRASWAPAAPMGPPSGAQAPAAGGSSTS
jgi:hypothetical protein